MSAELLRSAIDVFALLVETFGAGVIVVSAAWATLLTIVERIRHREDARFSAVRLSLGHFLIIGLEFQLAGALLRAAVAPGFSEIGQLAAIAAIRTAVNYFLAREIKDKQRQILEHCR